MTCIKTASGLNFDYTNPLPESICIEDISRGLSNDCRFAGQLPVFYSVAHHSWLMSSIVPAGFELEALLHDAAEAYCRDIPTPLKKLLPEYRAIEHRITAVIRKKYGLPAEMSEEVRRADLVMLQTERYELGIIDDQDWPQLKGIEPAKNISIVSFSPRMIEELFRDRFYLLTES